MHKPHVRIIVMLNFIPPHDYLGLTSSTAGVELKEKHASSDSIADSVEKSGATKALV